MATIPSLTPDQHQAAHSPARLLMIEAAPGTGKTRTATERFGVLRFRTGGQSQGVLVLSFTVAATQLLRTRIRERWGVRALVWPNRATTLDGVFRALLEYLLRSGHIRWPDGLTKLRVVDSWSGHAGRRLDKPGVLWDPSLKEGSVVAAKRPAKSGEFGLMRKKDLTKNLQAGICTHDDIRSIVLSALDEPDLREVLENYARTIASAVLVDEVFDVSGADIAMLELFVQAGCEITLIGDPWQALYAFRSEAEPTLVRERLVEPYGFVQQELHTSFRFEELQVQELAARLRNREAIVELPVIEHPDVVLAPQWRFLWEAPPYVLPLAFRQITSGAGAAVSLALDYFLRMQFGEGARLFDSALTLLHVEVADYLTAADDVYGPILDQLRNDGSDGAEAALEELCTCPKAALGAPRKPTLTNKARPALITALQGLSLRLAHGGPFVRGMSIHQAKGQEWRHVAVVLNDTDRVRLHRGLDPDDSEDRRLYVSLTRGRASSGVLPTEP